MVTSDAGHSIVSLSNSDGENTTFARVECLPPLPIALRKIRDRAGLTLKGSDAPLNAGLRKRQVLNLSLAIAVRYAGNRDMNNRAELAAILYAKNCKSRVRLVCRWRECPDLPGMKLRCGWRGLLGATAKKEREETHSDEECSGHALGALPHRVGVSGLPLTPP